MNDTFGERQYEGDDVHRNQTDWSELFKSERSSAPAKESVGTSPQTSATDNSATTVSSDAPTKEAVSKDVPSKDVPHIAASASATGSTAGDIVLVGTGLGIAGVYYLPWFWRRYCMPRAQPIGPFRNHFGFDISDSSGSDSGFGFHTPRSSGDANSPLRSTSAESPNHAPFAVESVGSPNGPFDIVESVQIGTTAGSSTVGTDAGVSINSLIDLSPEVGQSAGGRAILEMDENLAARSASILTKEASTARSAALSMLRYVPRV